VSLGIIVRLRGGRYDAACDDPMTPEWPPHPARLYCALVASAHDDADRDALRWLESVRPPEVWAAAEIATARSAGYVVVNKTEKKRSQRWPGRTNGLRQRTSALPRCDTFAVVWDADPEDATVGRLVRLAARVPYVGRSTSLAEVTVVRDPQPERPEWVRYTPVPLGTPGSVSLRVPFPGYLTELTAAYEEGIPAWQVRARVVTYAAESTVGSTPAEPEAAAGPYADLLIWGVKRPMVAIPGADLLTVTAALRRAVLSRVADPVPAQVSGHGADGRTHVAFLALLDVGHPHADGHLLGVGIAVPRLIPATDRRALLRGLLGADAADPLSVLRLRQGQPVELQYPALPLRGLRPERWCGDPGARSWVTATPMMLDRFPNRRLDVTEIIAESLRTAGYPLPDKVEPLAGPTVSGGIPLPRRGTLPPWARKPLMHCRVSFPRPVRGPVIAGALRYLGCGLFVPEAEHAVH